MSRDRVLRTAIGLADREGIDALTMRRLASELGVEAMTLYHHGLAPGLMSTWLNNWVLAFAVALPIAWVAVPATRALLMR